MHALWELVLLIGAKLVDWDATNTFEDTYEALEIRLSLVSPALVGLFNFCPFYHIPTAKTFFLNFWMIIVITHYSLWELVLGLPCSWFRNLGFCASCLEYSDRYVLFLFVNFSILKTLNFWNIISFILFRIIAEMVHMSQLTAFVFQRVKVYRLNDDGKWDDQGTGHVSVDYIEVCLWLYLDLA